MKMIGLKDTNLDACVVDAQHERIVITRNGKPLVLVVGVEGLDADQLDLGSSAKFWELMTDRRQQKTITREQLENKIRQTGQRRTDATKPGVAAGRASARKKRSLRAS